MNEVLKVKDLSFAYHEKLIFRQISFTVQKGDFVGIIGPNGAGKSTLLKLLLKILTPLEGTIEILGEDIRNFNGWPKIGYISQKSGSFNNNFPATVEEIVGASLLAKTGIFRKKPKDYKTRVYKALELVGMQDYGKNLIGRLSGGQQQGVFIARVLVSEPEFMFLDEPTSGIDIESEEAVYCLLARLNKELGITIIMVTHDIGAIAAHANRLVRLGEGGLSAYNINKRVTDEKLSEIFGYDVRIRSHKCLNCSYNEEGRGPC